MHRFSLLKLSGLMMLVAGTVFTASAQLGSGPVATAPASTSSQSTGGASTPSAPSPSTSPYQGSVPGKLENGVIPVSLQDAINRGLKTNLGLLLSSQDVNAARGERWKKLSALLPNVSATSYVDGSQVDLAEFGFSFKFPGVTIPSVVGPFGYYDARAYVTQSLFDLNAINKKRAADQDF
jgi:outer membrane protein TolC